MNCWHEYGKYKQFSYRHNWDKLQAYVPYAWMISARYIEHFNRDFHNCMWKIFYETPLHVNMSKQYAINKGINAVSSGYPMLDVFLIPIMYQMIRFGKTGEKEETYNMGTTSSYI